MTDPHAEARRIAEKLILNGHDLEARFLMDMSAREERLREFFDAWTAREHETTDFDLHAETVERFRRAHDAVVAAGPHAEAKWKKSFTLRLAIWLWYRGHHRLALRVNRQIIWSPDPIPPADLERAAQMAQERDWDKLKP